MQRINQNMTGFRMPAYVEEILTENYCKNFVRMSIIRDRGNYSFSYKPAGLSRLDPSSLSLYEKILLIRNLISLSENTSDHLIGAESYLIEPELVYAKGGNVDVESLRLLYYPDVKKLEFRYKIVLFADRILNKSKREEREMAERIRSAAEPGDINRLKLFLDKTVLRLENSMN
ncbi:MAG: hypothetical protein IJJ06_11980 [Mogibacterium sp.]|nr:hypothetical protein [Mogibacterium sp.]MBR0341922.1 hypothetical protein [Oscillospiraceae bacterium]